MPPPERGEEVKGSVGDTDGADSTATTTSVPRARSRRRHVRLGFKVVTLIGLVVLVLTQRTLIGSSLRVLAHLNWVWLPLAVELESASIAMFARMQRRLLRAGDAKVGLWPMLATTYAGNAISVSVPLAGTQIGTAYAFRRFRRLGVDGTLAGWALVVAGVVSSLASAMILAVGAILSGNDVVAVTGALGGVLGVIVVAVASLAIRHDRVEKMVDRPIVWVLHRVQRLINWPVGSAREVIESAMARLRRLHLSRSDWAKVLGLAFGNWLADVGVLAVSLLAVGADVPWHGLLFAYGVGAAVGSLGLTPGGLGVVEGTLAVALMGAGVHHGEALAGVLLYRFISLWMVSGVGWLVYLLGHGGGADAHPGTPSRAPRPAL
ncbi:MAG TPA: lysylphosphatidylglycerol synthase transmembrane domain-containing protein [Acidimicrobiales bacterium]